MHSGWRHGRACKHYYNTRYMRLPDLLIDLKSAKENNTYRKALSKYANPILFIFDKWLLLKPTQEEQQEILELLHRRRKRSSTIFYSQYTKNVLHSLTRFRSRTAVKRTSFLPICTSFAKKFFLIVYLSATFMGRISANFFTAINASKHRNLHSPKNASIPSAIPAAILP